jgi:hypothetical protein
MSASFALILTLLLGVFSWTLVCPAPVAQAETRDLISATGGVDQLELGKANNYACAKAAATMVIKYYIGRTNMSAAREFGIRDMLGYFDPSYRAKEKPTSEQALIDALVAAGADPALGIGGLQVTRENLAVGSWYQSLTAELDAGRPVIAFLENAEMLGYDLGIAPAYPHVIVVSGCQDDGTIEFWDPWGGAHRTLSKSEFEKVWKYQNPGEEKDPTPCRYWKAVMKASVTVIPATATTQPAVARPITEADIKRLVSPASALTPQQIEVIDYENFGDWAAAYVTAEEQESPLAVFRRVGLEWTLYELGTVSAEDLGPEVPAALKAWAFPEDSSSAPETDSSALPSPITVEEIVGLLGMPAVDTNEVWGEQVLAYENFGEWSVAVGTDEELLWQAAFHWSRGGWTLFEQVDASEQSGVDQLAASLAAAGAPQQAIDWLYLDM